MCVLYLPDGAGGVEPLYSLKRIKDSVGAILAVRRDVVLLEAQAHLHVLDGDYKKALAYYWELQVIDLLRSTLSRYASSRLDESCVRYHTCVWSYQQWLVGAQAQSEGNIFEPVFHLIEEHQLFEAVEDKVVNLVRMSKVCQSVLVSPSRVVYRGSHRHNITRGRLFIKSLCHMLLWCSPWRRIC